MATLRGIQGNDRRQGGEHDDEIFGRAGAEHLAGGRGRDSIFGGAGADRVFGQAGADLLAGQAGNDRISGGAGNDRITGGAGARNERGATDHDRSDSLDRTYSFKAWGLHQAEPAGWAIQHTMVDQEPFGSFYLNAPLRRRDLRRHHSHRVAAQGRPVERGRRCGPALGRTRDHRPTAAPAVLGKAVGASEPPAVIADLSPFVANRDDPAVAA
jgi:hypothetical protein